MTRPPLANALAGFGDRGDPRFMLPVTLHIAGMRMREGKRISAFAFTAVLLLACCTARGSAPETFQQALQRLGIRLDRSSLIAALHNPDKQVRGLAAAQLEENKDEAAIPDIENELARETDVGTRINVAAALGQLGDRLGIAALRDVCANAGIRLYERLDAVRHLLFLHEEACATTVIVALSDDSEEPLTNKRNALGLVDGFGRYYSLRGERCAGQTG